MAAEALYQRYNSGRVQQQQDQQSQQDHYYSSRHSPVQAMAYPVYTHQPPSPTSVLLVPPLPLLVGKNKAGCNFGSSTSSGSSSLGDLVNDLVVVASSFFTSLTASQVASIRILIAITSLVTTPFLIYKSFPAETLLGNLQTIVNTWDALMRFSGFTMLAMTWAVAFYVAPSVLGQCHHAHHQQQHQHTTSSLSTQLQEPLLYDDQESQESHSQIQRMRYQQSPASKYSTSSRNHSSHHKEKVPKWQKFKSFWRTVDGMAIAWGLSVGMPIAITGSLPLVIPSWGWQPLGWFSYHVYRPHQMQSVLQGVCPDQSMHDIILPTKPSKVSQVLSSLFGREDTLSRSQRQHLPLCLPESSWEALNAGSLSSYRKHDVQAVMKGLAFARPSDNSNHKHGLAIAVLARDISNDLASFRQNVESLRPFFSQLAVVIFENDSKDGSREAIQEWADAMDGGGVDRGYHVDLMECAEAPGCKFGKKHRDSDTISYAKSRAIGDMDVYRQRVADYITTNPKYQSFSHMMVIDIDLAISLSPLGVLHTLGQHPENAVASSGRMLWPSSFGSLTAPYDFSAFRPWATEKNHNVLSWHESYCGLMEKGDRWRNMCDASSPALMMEVLRNDRGDWGMYGNGDEYDYEARDFYRVESAFNGAVLYPLDLVRDSQASYDAGEDGQRCEHIGFHLALKKPMYVNRRWNMHVSPDHLGGPTGWRATKAINHVTTTPRLLGTMILCQFFGYFLFIYNTFMLGVFLVYPLTTPISSGGKSIRRIISSRRLRHGKSRYLLQGHDEALAKIV